MLIKLGILAVVIVGTLIAFSPEINKYFPNTITNSFESLKLDLDSITSQTTQSADQKIDLLTQESSAMANEAFDSAGRVVEYAEDQFSMTSDRFEEDLAEFTDTSATFVEENITDKVESIDVDALIPGT